MSVFNDVIWKSVQKNSSVVFEVVEFLLINKFWSHINIFFLTALTNSLISEFQFDYFTLFTCLSCFLSAVMLFWSVKGATHLRNVWQTIWELFSIKGELVQQHITVILFSNHFQGKEQSNDSSMLAYVNVLSFHCRIRWSCIKFKVVQWCFYLYTVIFFWEV